MKNLYRPIESVIEDIKPETPNITTYRFRPKEPISFAAGQFVELTVPGVGEAPFTPSSNPNVTDTMEITIMEVGTVTEALTKLKECKMIATFRGPLPAAHFCSTQRISSKLTPLISSGMGRRERSPVDSTKLVTGNSKTPSRPAKSFNCQSGSRQGPPR